MCSSDLEWTGSVEIRLSPSTLGWKNDGDMGDVLYIGKGGFGAFYGTQYIYFSKDEGWHMSTGRSGFTCGGVLDVNGAVRVSLGTQPFTAVKHGIGIYEIKHDLGTLNYVVNATTTNEYEDLIIGYGTKTYDYCSFFIKDKDGQPYDAKVDFTIHM